MSANADSVSYCQQVFSLEYIIRMRSRQRPPMKMWFTLMMLSAICFAQSTPSSLETEHARGVQQNPTGVTLTISLVDPVVMYHFNHEIRLRLTFSSDLARVYTAELAPGGSAASASDDLVFQGPEMSDPIHSQASEPPKGVVCCGTRRRYVAHQPIATIAYVTVPSKNLFSNAPKVLFPTPPTGLKAGDYAIYVQTKRLLRGWPKSGREQYFAASDIVLTSNNILHITIVPDASSDGPTP
jgi:hypothetical protein